MVTEGNLEAPGQRGTVADVTPPPPSVMTLSHWVELVGDLA